MVIGVDRFRDHFAGHETQYVLIGGAACEQIMDEVGLPFRATKDLDVVLIVEALDPAFADRFHAFIAAGEYEIRQSSEGERCLYRFAKPKVEGYPAQIELFARKPDGLILAEDTGLTPLPFEEEVSSLSAILLNEDYYAFLKSMVRQIGGLPILGEAGLIPFKARAWWDLTERRDAGQRVDAGDIAKHRRDVARMLQVLPQNASFDLPESIRDDMQRFVSALVEDETFAPRQFGVPIDRADVIARLRSAYGL